MFAHRAHRDEIIMGSIVQLIANISYLVVVVFRLTPTVEYAHVVKRLRELCIRDLGFHEPIQARQHLLFLRSGQEYTDEKYHTTHFMFFSIVIMSNPEKKN